MSAEIDHFSNITCIDPDILAEVLKDQQDDSSDILVVDVRDDDYGSLSIKNAINIPSLTFELEDTKSNLFQRIKDDNKKVVIFHCMKSQVRGPTCAVSFKNYIDNFKEGEDVTIQVLSGGFSKWKHLYENDDTLVSRRRQY